MSDDVYLNKTTGGHAATAPTKFRWASPGRVPSSGGTKYQIPNTKKQIPNTKYQIPNTKYPIPNTKYLLPNLIPNT